MPRTILHLDLDAFFCAVEELLNPDLRGKPFIVGGRPDERGVVSSASYPARHYGVRSAMPTARALKLCPQALVLPARHRLYGQYSDRVMNLLAEYSPLVEQISIDEAFVDLTGDPRPGREIAARMQSRIRDEIGLPCSLGVATSKLVAKIATEVGKLAHGDAPTTDAPTTDAPTTDAPTTARTGRPASLCGPSDAPTTARTGRPASLCGPSDAPTTARTSRPASLCGPSGGPPVIGPPFGLRVVPPGEEADFLAPLPVEMLWGIGPKTAAQLAGLGIRTMGQLAAWPEGDLSRRFGASGAAMCRHARGLDDRPVVAEREAKQISQETTFARDISDGAVLRRTLLDLAEGVGRRLRAEKVAAATIKLKLRWPDFTTVTRQVTLEGPTDLDDEIYRSALGLFGSVWRRGKAVRLLGVGASGLGPPMRQMGLWEAGKQARAERLVHAVDAIRERYGEKAIRRAALAPPPPSGRRGRDRG